MEKAESTECTHVTIVVGFSIRAFVLVMLYSSTLFKQTQIFPKKRRTSYSTSRGRIKNIYET